jgi:hypothetical protein
MLNALNPERLTDKQRETKAQLNGWYGSYYAPLTEAIYQARAEKNTATYDDLMRQLEESVGQPGAARRGRPSRPSGPSRPQRPR